MQLVRKNNTLLLHIPPDIYISFRESWIRDLRQIKYEEFGDYIRQNIYPVFSAEDRSFWNKSTINNMLLQEAIEEFFEEEKE